MIEERRNELPTEKRDSRTKIVTEGIENVNQESFNNPRYRGQMIDSNNNYASASFGAHQDSCGFSKIEMVADKAKILIIEIINSTSEPKGLTLKINPFGLVNGQRGSQDGVTYFGFEDLDSSEVRIF